MVVTTETECKEIASRSCYCSFFHARLASKMRRKPDQLARMYVVLERITPLRVFKAVVQLRGDENGLFAFV